MEKQVKNWMSKLLKISLAMMLAFTAIQYQIVIAESPEANPAGPSAETETLDKEETTSDPKDGQPTAAPSDPSVGDQENPNPTAAPTVEPEISPEPTPETTPETTPSLDPKTTPAATPEIEGGSDQNAENEKNESFDYTITTLVQPEGSAKIVAPAGMNGEDTVNFMVKPEAGYTVVRVMVNDEPVLPVTEELENTETSELEEGTLVYQIQGAQQDIVIQAELEKTEILIPAADYTAETEDAQIIVSVPEGAFNEEVRLQAEKITDPAVLAAMSGTVENALKDDQLVVEMAAYDISFISLASNEEIEPRTPVTVKITLKTPLAEKRSEALANPEMNVVHIAEDAAAEVVATENAEATQITFEAESFSTYVVTMTTQAACEYRSDAYESLNAAITAAIQAGDEVPIIQLRRDVTESVKLPKSKFDSINFELCGNSWTGDQASIITIQDGTLALLGTGQLNNAEGYRAITAENTEILVRAITFSGSGSLQGESKLSIDGNRKTTGGFIQQVGGSLTIDECSFINNSVEGSTQDIDYGGAISLVMLDNGGKHDAEIMKSEFKGNRGMSGSDIAAVLSSTVMEGSFKLVVDDCAFTDSTAASGSVYAEAGSFKSNADLVLNLTGSTFDRTSGIFVKGSEASPATLRLENTNIDNAAETQTSRAVYATDTHVIFEGGEIKNHNVNQEGTVYIGDGSLAVNGTNFSNNTATVGGAVYMTHPITNCLISNAVFDGNTATSNSTFGTTGGGAIAIVGMPSDVNITFDRSTASYNTTGRNGGAMLLEGKGGAWISGTFIGNTAANNGGAIAAHKLYSLTFNQTTMTNNTAMKADKGAGGGLYFKPGERSFLNLDNETHIYNNSAPKDPQTDNGNGSAGVSSEIFIDNSATSKAEVFIDNSSKTSSEFGTIYTLTKYTKKINKNAYTAGYYSQVETPVKIYLASSDEVHTDQNSIVKTTLAEAVQEAEVRGLDKIYLCDTITVSAAEEDLLNNHGMMLIRCSEHPDSNMLDIKGKVTLDGAHLDGVNLDSKESLISVGSGAELIIAGSTIIENGAAELGGGIVVNQGLLTMTGGTIQNNRADLGGGVYVQGAKAIVNFEGGLVANNRANAYGAGIYVQDHGTVNFGLAGGRTILSHNVSVSEGGGICYEMSSKGSIVKATFTENESTTDSMYVSGAAISIKQGAFVEMKNLYVSNNRSTSSKWAHYGALYTCPTGETAIFEINGALIIDNKNDRGYQTTDIYHNIGDNGNTVYVSDVALGGGDITYLNAHNLDEVLDRSAYQYTANSFSLISRASQQTKQWAKEAAEEYGVVVTGNKGGGPGFAIANNGHLKIGTDTDALQVVKTWTNKNGKPLKNHPDQVLVYLTRDGELIDEATRRDAAVVLSEDNNWNYIWTNLEVGHDWSVVEAAVDGFASRPGEKIKTEAPFNQDFDVENFYQITLDNRKDDSVKNVSLSVKKTAYQPKAAQTEFEFTVKLSPMQNPIAYTLTSKDGQQSKLMPVYHPEEFTLTLQDGEQFTLVGLPKGTQYSIEEASGNYWVYVDDELNEDRLIAGELQDQPRAHHFVNLAKVSLTVEKQLEHYSESFKGATFVFEITGTAPQDDYPVTSYNQIAALTFDGAGTQSLVIPDLPYGLDYTVKEIYGGSVYTAQGTDTFFLPASVWESADELEDGVSSVVPEDGGQVGLKVRFVNDFNENQNSGSGIVNHYSVEAGEIKVNPVYEKAE